MKKIIISACIGVAAFVAAQAASAHVLLTPGSTTGYQSFKASYNDEWTDNLGNSGGGETQGNFYPIEQFGGANGLLSLIESDLVDAQSYRATFKTPKMEYRFYTDAKSTQLAVTCIVPDASFNDSVNHQYTIPGDASICTKA